MANQEYNKQEQLLSEILTEALNKRLEIIGFSRSQPDYRNIFGKNGCVSRKAYEAMIKELIESEEFKDIIPDERLKRANTRGELIRYLIDPITQLEGDYDSFQTPRTLR